ncbi:hypothetical protein HNR19_004124 [Nocardioides thalensis]|uniref:GvpL/GvpF family gas vesicle protein n=1 Tax=Nocardioides thalensis TaxID=1914755 RepID=A0A853C8S8_9ACTN|nr:GvpL/GvpF family gas vesicle protein [Nocardioides thalensis]NYJ03426.1 hypothetical protein [Nocardioides thalensis]
MTVTAEVESGLLVYGVVPAGTALPDLSGVGDAPLSLLPHAGLAAVVGPVPIDRPRVGPAELRAYHAVVDALASAGPVAPVRFGAVLRDEADVVDALLAPHAATLTELLATLEGRRQLKLRARFVEDVVLAEVVAADPVIRDLRERTLAAPEAVSWADRVRLGELVAHAVEQRRDAEAGALWDLVAPHAVELRESPGSGTDHVVDLALLVDDDRIPGLERTLEAYAEAAYDRVRLSLSGPLPPYDFVEASWA